MQMYKVEFATHHPGMIERGSYLVCAPTNEAACAFLAYHLKLPASTTQCQAERVKPSVWKLAHTEIVPHEKKTSLRNWGGRLEERPVKHKVEVSAVIEARNDADAVRRVARRLTDRDNMKALGRNPAPGLYVDCHRLNGGGDA